MERAEGYHLGVTGSQYRLIGACGSTCMTCPAPADRVDHDHQTGLVRGLLGN
ncbi:endonuclease domain-containing protein [Amycolatopsis vastitatis]|uniref:endonuclease domain-containing protein n=1 Tax=Amycolatopsis vastitatis TaxID=1905142 RepID=UPI0034DE2235